MVKNLENFYYYLSEGDKGVVYEISYVQDKDKCGKHLVTYMTEPKELTEGAYYYDLHGDKQKVEEAGTYQVKKEDGSLDLEACKSVFPYVEVKYYKALRDPRTGAYVKDGQGNYVKDTETLYIDMYWYQDRIQDGDTVDDNGKFVMKPDHHVFDDSQTYIDDVESATWNTVTSLILSGADDDRLYSTAPLYIGKDAGWIKHFGTKVIVTDVTNSENKEFDFSKTAINDKIAEIVQEKILNEYADIMSKYDIPIDWPEPCEECGDCPVCPECTDLESVSNVLKVCANNLLLPLGKEVDEEKLYLLNSTNVKNIDNSPVVPTTEILNHYQYYYDADTDRICFISKKLFRDEYSFLGNTEISYNTGDMNEYYSQIFPNIHITLYDGSNVKEVYFYFQDLIIPSDSVSPNGETQEGKLYSFYTDSDDGNKDTYLKKVASSYKTEINRRKERGEDSETIKNALPWWVFVNSQDEYTYEGFTGQTRYITPEWERLAEELSELLN